MASNSFYTNYVGDCRTRLYISSSLNNSDNSSTVSWALYSQYTGGGDGRSIRGSWADIRYYPEDSSGSETTIAIYNADPNIDPWTFSDRDDHLFASGSVTVPHRSSGKQTIHLVVSMGYGSSYSGNATIDDYLELDSNTKTLTLKTSTGISSVSPSGTTTYKYGTKVTISATPSSGYKFSKWSDGSTYQSRTITLTSNKTLTAYATLITYKATINYNGSAIATTSSATSIPIKYNSKTIKTISSASTCTLSCSNKIASTDITVGDKTLSCSGKIMNSDVTITVTQDS